MVRSALQFIHLHLHGLTCLFETWMPAAISEFIHKDYVLLCTCRIGIAELSGADIDTFIYGFEFLVCFCRSACTREYRYRTVCWQINGIHFEV